MKHKYFECMCSHPMHIMRLTWFEDEPEVYVTVILNESHPWWKRVWYAFKYIFKLNPSKYYYGDIIWDSDTISDLKNFLIDIEYKNDKLKEKD